MSFWRVPFGTGRLAGTQIIRILKIIILRISAKICVLNLIMIYKIKGLKLLLFFSLNILFLNPTYSHDLELPQYSDNKKVPVRSTVINHFKERGEYRITLSYYPVGYTGIFDFSVRAERIDSGFYYNKGLEFKIIDPQGIERVSYIPFLDNEYNYKMRQVLKDKGQYLFIIQFDQEEGRQEITLPFEIKEQRIEDICSWCSMLITNTKTVHFLILDDGVKKACCIHCAIDFRKKFDDKFTSMESVDYYSDEKIDSQKAWFLNDSNIILKDSMPPYVVAFRSLESAKDFQKTYDGEIIDYNRLEHEILGKKDSEFSSEEDEELFLLEELILRIKENYYKDIDVKELVKLSVNGIITALDQYSSLKKIKPSSLDFIRGFDRDETISDIRIINDNIGYIKIKHFGRRTKEGFKKAMMDFRKIDPRGLIIDIRDNPGELRRGHTDNGILYSRRASFGNCQ